jgi:choline dehydrogenase-like flavoprotein
VHAPLPASTVDILRAVVARIVHSPPASLADRVAERVAALPGAKRRDAVRGITLFGSRGAALVSVGSATRFVDLPVDAQDRMLAAWLASPVPIARTVAQLLRRLTLLTHYTDPAVTTEIGYLGPFHARDVVLPFEGPLRGDTASVGPVQVIAAPPNAPIPRPPAAHIGDADVLHADAVVIGTGAGGAVAAARLAEAGKDVIILEQGALFRSDAFTEREGEMIDRLYADRGLRATDDLSLAMLQGVTVGGSTTVNWMIMLRTPAHVLEEWTRRFGLDGMRAAEMAPEFARIEREVHAGLVPEHAHSANNALLLRGAAALGWRASSAMINARGCVRTGFCGMGCRYDAKMGTLLTYIPRAVAAGARLLPDTHAMDITRAPTRTHPHPRWRVRCRTRGADGTIREVAIDASRVIVAGGAVETPLLLQRSGLGGGAVGRYLRVHPTSAVVAIHDDMVYGAGGMPLTAMCDEFIQRDARRYGFWLECPPMHPGLASVALPAFGDAHRSVMRRFPHLATTIALTRDGSDLDHSSGRVTRGAGGIPSIRYRLSPADADNVRESLVAAARLQLAAGAREVRTLHVTPCVIRTEADLARIRDASLAPNMLSLFTAHVNGTARIGTDPRESAVDPTGARFGARGIYILDGSLLPTGVGVNPQETIMAFSSVLSTRMVESWR